MPADIGTKALPVEPFVRLRDIANGYSLVKAAYPNFPMSNLVYEGKAGDGDASLQECSVSSWDLPLSTPSSKTINEDQELTVGLPIGVRMVPKDVFCPDGRDWSRRIISLSYASSA